MFAGALWVAMPGYNDPESREWEPELVGLHLWRPFGASPCYAPRLKIQ